MISIHAPVKGATVINAKWPAAVFNFNPRTREGCDLGQFVLDFARILISIHAPVKGATVIRCCIDQRFRISIHAPVKGATRISWQPSGRTGNFNPRTREGCDATGSSFYAGGWTISIHAPVKGATCSTRADYNQYLYFNPRTREGCDQSG